MPFGDEPDAPQGFRPVSITQAMMEYAAPIMAYVADGTVADPNDALQVGLLLWNSTLPAVPVPMRQSRGEIVAHIETMPHMNWQEAEVFYDEIIERKAYLTDGVSLLVTNNALGDIAIIMAFLQAGWECDTLPYMEEPMTTVDFITALFCQVDDHLPVISKHL